MRIIAIFRFAPRSPAVAWELAMERDDVYQNSRPRGDETSRSYVHLYRDEDHVRRVLMHNFPYGAQRTRGFFC